MSTDNKVTLKHKYGFVKEVKVGFSWEMFFFGFLYLFIVGYAGLGIMYISFFLAIWWSFGWGGAALFFISLALNTLFAIVFNRLWVQYLLKEGYYLANIQDESKIKEYL